MTAVKVLVLALVTAAVVGTLVMLNSKGLNHDGDAATNGAAGKPMGSGAADDLAAAAATTDGSDNSKQATGEGDRPMGTSAKKAGPNQKKTFTKDINQADLDWIRQTPNPNISVSTTIKSVQRYRKAVEALNERTQVRSLEIVFHMGERAAQDVVYASGKMDPDEYASVEPQMQGFIFDRRGIFEVYPDYEYFEKLANSRGGGADQDFFATGRELTVHGISKYYNQITEVSSCTNYGPGLVVNAYQKWSDYQSRYPSSYVAEVDKKIAEAVSELTTNNCLCGRENSLYDEYAYFFKVFPNAPLTTDLRSRMKEIKDGTLKVEPDCKATLSDGKFR